MVIDDIRHDSFETVFFENGQRRPTTSAFRLMLVMKGRINIAAKTHAHQRSRLSARSLRGCDG